MTDHHVSPFPPEFVWGVSTSAYQIEGASGEDGRGESVWDRFCTVPGVVRNGESGEIACDFYHRYPEDVELMRELGVDTFRFSISWPRVLPEGRGRVNEAGLDFYDRLVDALLAAGIEPWPTLFHWDLPQRLEDAGGWPERATTEAFAEYAEAVAARLGDRVTWWITHNEPRVMSQLGYGEGIFAPGRRSDADALAAAHHLLLSHGLAAAVLRRDVPGAKIGIALDLTDAVPATDSEADRDAARRLDGTINRLFLDPVLRGSYPDDLPQPFGGEIDDADLRTISAPLDFLGVNYYHRQVVRAPGEAELVVSPQGFTDVLVRLRDEYAPPAIVVTENGTSFGDAVGHDGRVRDPERQAYIADHLDAVARALDAGVPVTGYLVWSLLDNFEWSDGYWKRFGLVYVDFPTLERIPKGSFYWYRDFIARRHRAGAARTAIAQRR